MAPRPLGLFRSRGSVSSIVVKDAPNGRDVTRTPRAANATFRFLSVRATASRAITALRSIRHGACGRAYVRQAPLKLWAFLQAVFSAT